MVFQVRSQPQPARSATSGWDLFLDDAMSLITDGHDFFFDGREVQGKKDYAETEFYNKLIRAIDEQAKRDECVTLGQAMEELKGHDRRIGASPSGNSS